MYSIITADSLSVKVSGWSSSVSATRRACPRNSGTTMVSRLRKGAADYAIFASLNYCGGGWPASGDVMRLKM